MAKLWDDKLNKWREATAAESAAFAGEKLPAQLIDYDRWMSETARTLRRRGEKLQRVDFALAQYQAKPGAFTFAVLKKQFGDWKASKADWTQSGRNQNESVSLLDRQLSGGRDSDILVVDAAFMEEGLIHARLGIVYLFAHLDCDNFFNILTHGVLDVATAGIDYGAASLKISDKASGIDPTKDQRISDLKTASSIPGGVTKVTDKIEEAVRKKIGNSSLEDGSIDLVPKTQHATPVWLTFDTPPPPSGKLRELWDKIREKLYAVAQKIYKWVLEKFDTVKDTAREMWADKKNVAIDKVPGLLRKLVDFLLGKLVATIAPLVGGALDLVKGIATTIDAVVDKVKEWQGAKNVTVLPGAPSTICQAIRNAMYLCIGEGLYDTVKGAANITMDVFSGGAAAIAKLVIAVIEALTSTIYKLVEIARMRACFADARGQWLVRGADTALYKQPIAFNNWFKSYALTTPALAMLALNSGICGDKMHFLQMFRDDSSVITQASFDAGVKYVDELKIWGAGYLKDSGFNFVSNSAMASGLLKVATSHRDPGESVAKRVLFSFLGA